MEILNRFNFIFAQQVSCPWLVRRWVSFSKVRVVTYSFTYFKCAHMLIKTSHFPRLKATECLSFNHRCPGHFHGTHVVAGWSAGITSDTDHISLFFLDLPGDLNSSKPQISHQKCRIYFTQPCENMIPSHQRTVSHASQDVSPLLGFANLVADAARSTKGKNFGISFLYRSALPEFIFLLTCCTNTADGIKTGIPCSVLWALSSKTEVQLYI